MYRSNLNIGIDGEDPINSSSCEYMHTEQIGIVPQMYFLRGLRTGISMLTLIAMINTIPTEDVHAKISAAPSAIVEKGDGLISYQVLAGALDNKMSDDEFNKAMAALNNIWSVCPGGIPKDLSTKHDYYLFEEKK